MPLLLLLLLLMPSTPLHAQGDADVGRELAQQRRFHQPHAGRHEARRAIGVPFQVAPLGILLINDAFHPLRQRSKGHLDEITGVIDSFGERSRKHDQLSAVGGSSIYGVHV